MKKGNIDYSTIDYKSFRRMLQELESAGSAADNTKAAQIQQQIAKLDDQIAKIQLQKAGLQKQLDAIEKK
jgi:septal ring factor EnvC (AmiA/AmiB activator)